MIEEVRTKLAEVIELLQSEDASEHESEFIATTALMVAQQMGAGIPFLTASQVERILLDSDLSVAWARKRIGFTVT